MGSSSSARGAYFQTGGGADRGFFSCGVGAGVGVSGGEAEDDLSPSYSDDSSRLGAFLFLEVVAEEVCSYGGGHTGWGVALRRAFSTVPTAFPTLVTPPVIVILF